MVVCEVGEEGEGYPCLGHDGPAFKDGAGSAAAGVAVVDADHW